MGDIDFESYIGMPTADAVITIERAPVTAFAASVKDDSAVYRNADAAAAAGFDGIPTPPTYVFSAAQFFGKFEEEQPDGVPDDRNPMAEVMGGLMAGGGMILHGEQSFDYIRPVVVGEKLRLKGVVKDIYQKVSGERTMTFMVVEDTYTDGSGVAVLVSTMNLIHRS